MSAPIEIRLVAFTKGMDSAALARWLAPEGGWVAEGDVLAEIETDKATMEIEAPLDGVLTRRLAPAGSSKIPVGQVLATFTPGPRPEAGVEPTPAGATARLAPAPPPIGPSATLTVEAALRLGLDEALRAEPRLRVLASGVGEGGVSRGLDPARRIDAPDAPDAALEMAIGVLATGAAPLAPWIRLDSVAPAVWEALALRSERWRTPAVVIAAVDRGTRALAPSGARALAPCDPAQARAVLAQAARAPTEPGVSPGLTLVLVEEAFLKLEGEAPFRLDADGPPGPRLARAGGGPLLIAWGAGVAAALSVAERMDAAVVDLVRLDAGADDRALILALRDAKRGVVVDPWPGLGYADAWIARLSAECHGALERPLRRAAPTPEAILASLIA
jgi:pyruvate/2-oxoglutarate/acetoin dehydrogenase E1 component